MSKTPRKEAMAQEYDFSGAERGKYAERCAQRTNAVLLEPDLRPYFPDSHAVNEALRLLVRAMRAAADATPGSLVSKS